MLAEQNCASRLKWVPPASLAPPHINPAYQNKYLALSSGHWRISKPLRNLPGLQKAHGLPDGVRSWRSLADYPGTATLQAALPAVRPGRSLNNWAHPYWRKLAPQSLQHGMWELSSYVRAVALPAVSFAPAFQAVWHTWSMELAYTCLLLFAGALAAGAMPLIVPISDAQLGFAAAFSAGLLISAGLSVVIPEGFDSFHSAAGGAASPDRCLGHCCSQTILHLGS